MSGKARPSARKKTLFNVMNSELSVSDKKCIEEVFTRYDNRCNNCDLEHDCPMDPNNREKLHFLCKRPQ